MFPPWQLRYDLQYRKFVRMPLRGRLGHVQALQKISKCYRFFANGVERSCNVFSVRMI